MLQQQPTKHLAEGYDSNHKLRMHRKPDRSKKIGLIETQLAGINITNYVPSQWTCEAYGNIFEKFGYASISEFDPIAFSLAKKRMYDEYSYMYGAKHTPIPITTKNPDSTPGIPAMFEYDSEVDMIEALGLSCYEHALESLKHGPLDFLWYGFLKNEMLKKDKVERGDIRLICCAPAVYCRVGAYFEEEMNTRQKSRCYEREAKIGWSPFGGAFRGLLDKISRSDEFIELDYTRYDGTIPDLVWDEVNELRIRAYQGDNKDAYVNYRQNLHGRKMVLTTGDMVVMDQGNPSGQYSTSTDNCIAQTLIYSYLMSLWWKENRGTYPTLTELCDFYGMITYGDDHLSYYNLELGTPSPSPEWLMDAAKRYLGMWIKPENVKKSNRLEGLSFCGMTFAKAGRSWVGKYKSDKILASIVEPSQPAENLEVMENKFASALLLTLWNDDVYSNEIRTLSEKFTHLKPNWERPSAEDLKDIWAGPKA